MKRLTLLLLLVSTMLIVPVMACKKASKLTQFEMKYSTTAVIESSIGINLPINILTPPVQTNSEQTFSNENTRADLLEKVALTSCVLKIKSPSNGNFSFLNAIEVFISADGLQDVKLAGKTNIPDNQGNELVLETTGEDVKEFLKKSVFSLRLKTTTDQVITQDYEIAIDAVFFVDAKILGL